MQFVRITHNPAVMGGKPCIRGLRVTVGTILGLLASGKSRERILQAYPYLEPEDIDAALAYAYPEGVAYRSPGSRTRAPWVLGHELCLVTPKGCTLKFMFEIAKKL